MSQKERSTTREIRNVKKRHKTGNLEFFQNIKTKRQETCISKEQHIERIKRNRE